MLQIGVCKEQIEWARAEKRSFLRQRIEMRLSTLLIETEEYQQATQLVNGLLTEVKRLDDKLLLVDVHLIESRLHHLLVNTPKSKAALTAARSAANSVYVPPSLQVRITRPLCSSLALGSGAAASACVRAGRDRHAERCAQRRGEGLQDGVLVLFRGV